MDIQNKNEEKMYPIDQEQQNQNWYTDRVYAFLLKFRVGEKFIIEQKVKPENREAFVEAVKRFIGDQGFLQPGFQVEFKSDYSEIRKIQFPAILNRVNQA